MSQEKIKPDHGKADSNDTIRVNVDILDNLMNQVGELVLIRNQVLQVDLKKIEPSAFLNLSQRLNVITSELQNEIMRTRMQPIGKVLSKFNRVVRDIANNIQKKIELELEGTETELDKSLIEAIKDPLTHIVRNSCDHGIELPEERVQQGKAETGMVRIRSYHEGGQVVIEISDNGKGLNPDKLIEKAQEKGLIAKDEGERMSDKEAFNLIFHPGFSTAQKVSNLSGRGVGMDVVKSNIESIGGMVELSSVTGQGTTLRLKIPLTLAILPALIIKSSDLYFAVPQVKLVELLRIKTGQKSEGVIEDLQGQPVYRLRGELLPLVYLNKILERDSGSNDSPEWRNIAVLRSDSAVFGLIMDEIRDSADIVVKPLANFLKGLEVYSGATVLGSGSIAMVLDVNGLSRSIRLENKDSFRSSKRNPAPSSSETGVQHEYLVIDIFQESQFAIQLELVNRLEEFPIKAIEQAGHRRVVQYRGCLLPLINVCKALKLEQGKAQREVIHVVVVNYLDRLFGLEVDSIEDVFSSLAAIDTDTRDRRGILGDIIVEDKVYVVLDIIDIIQQAGIYKDGIELKEPLKEAS